MGLCFFFFFFFLNIAVNVKKWVLMLLYDFLGYCDHSQPLQSMLWFYDYLESMWSVWYSFFPFLVLDKSITLESSGGIVYVKLSARFGLVMTKLFYIQRLNSLKCLLRVSKIVLSDMQDGLSVIIYVVFHKSFVHPTKHFPVYLLCTSHPLALF